MIETSTSTTFSHEHSAGVKCSLTPRVVLEPGMSRRVIVEPSRHADSNVSERRKRLYRHTSVTTEDRESELGTVRRQAGSHATVLVVVGDPQPLHAGWAGLPLRWRYL